MTHTHSVPGDLASPLELVMSRAEESSPEHDWPAIYELCHRKGLDPEKKSFSFKLVNSLLASRLFTSWATWSGWPSCRPIPARPASCARPHSL